MRNNSTFGINYPTGSIGRYATENINETTNTFDETIHNVHNTKGIKGKTQNHKTKAMKNSFNEKPKDQK